MYGQPWRLRKNAQTAQLQDELTGALIGLARATVGDTLATEETWNVMITACLQR